MHGISEVGVSECSVGDMKRVQEPQIDSLCVSDLEAQARCGMVISSVYMLGTPLQPRSNLLPPGSQTSGAVDSGVLSKLYELQSSKLQLQGILSKRCAATAGSLHPP